MTIKERIEYEVREYIKAVYAEVNESITDEVADVLLKHKQALVERLLIRTRNVRQQSETPITS